MSFSFRFVCCICVTCFLNTSAKQLPIYIEDSHAGSFGFFAQELHLEKSYTLILIDEHSDASGVPGSDRVRTALRKVASVQQRKENVDKMRGNGTIQPFNWIEPLMPKPITKVIWIAGENLTNFEIAEKQREARIHLDWHTQAEDRSDRLFSERYLVTDWKRFKRQIKQDNLGDIIVSIDLDYFVDIPQPIENLRDKWNLILGWEGLEAVSFALSMPWQKDKQIADDLLHAAFENALSIEASKIQFEPYLTDFNDRSEMVKSYLRKGLNPPRYKISKATPKLRKLLVRKCSRIKVTHNPLAWEDLLREWGEGDKISDLEIRNAHQSIDGVWRLRQDKLDDIWLKSGDENITKIRWWIHQPTRSSYNIIPKSGLGKGFAENAPAYVVSKRTLIAETEDLALASTTWRSYLHSVMEIGIVKIQAELVTEKGSSFTNVMEIRVRKQDGFLGSLEEQFGSPYVFGIGSFKQAGESGPETLLGNDCANFLIYALRQNGKQLSWCNPAQIKQFLEPIKGAVKAGDIVHLRSHVAVLYKDKGRIGKLDDEDIIVHHLSGFPEFISLGKLAKGKPYIALRIKREQIKSTLTIGGDVCLHGEVNEVTNVMVANLECVVSDDAKPLMNKRFQYIVPKREAEQLKSFSLLSLANNHAGDGGERGLSDTMNYLDELGTKHVGAGTLDEAAKIKIILVNGQKVGFLGLNLIERDVLPAKEGMIGVTTYPAHRNQIKESIKDARNAGVKCIIALPHWGDEYTTKVNQEQRECAKWLIRNGVNIIVGSHPHRPQRCEFYRGKLIVYSMGNLIFTPQKQPGFNLRSCLNINLTENGSLLNYQRTDSK